MAGLFEEEAAPAFSGPSLFAGEPESAPQAAAYRVLARKYRPTTFDDLIGQDALVRTLRNAFAMNRIAHAFMLTGVRGVGKTTTARILARALNCIGPDGAGAPTPDPCGVCENCVAILADRHPDVVEMDAASNTGVDDVREIIEATRFRPLTARIKVFIIDEVHMLSRNAFNALLKTLEEPPPHVKFVFATTEIRKVPVTVLSRCQRFDLRRVSIAELTSLFLRIAQKENVNINVEAINYIARAADGSVRDGLSLLDQAIARGSEDATEISAAMVAEMLGLADRAYVFDLMDAIMTGDAAAALAITDNAHARGADLGVLLGDLLALAHLLARLKAVPTLSDSAALPELERSRGAALAEKLSIPWLGRLWQMLLKGVAEVESAPDRKAAAEMIIIRLCHVADMPPPAELIKKLTDQPSQLANPPSLNGGGPPGGARAVANGAAIQMQPAPAAAPKKIDFTDVVALAGKRDVMLYAHLRQSAHLVRFAPPVIELRLEPAAPRDFSQRLAALLESETSRRWTIAISQAQGDPTIAEREQAAQQSAHAEATDHPLVRAILETFPGARIETLAPPPDISDSPPADWAEFAPPEAEPANAAYYEEEDFDR
jgi:DNA polymerase-3 subunit gamma/tau